MGLRLPDFPSPPDHADAQTRIYFVNLQQWWGGVQQELEDMVERSFRGAANKNRYVLTNVSIIRDFNPTSATDSYLANRFATLLYDLKQKGIIQ